MINEGSFLFPRSGTGARYGESVSNKILSRGISLIISRRSLAFLKEWSEAEKLIFRAVELEPENKIIQGMKYQFLEGSHSIIAHDSIYDIKLRVTVRDSSGNLVSVLNASIMYSNETTLYFSLLNSFKCSSNCSNVMLVLG